MMNAFYLTNLLSLNSEISVSKQKCWQIILNLGQWSPVSYAGCIGRSSKYQFIIFGFKWLEIKTMIFSDLILRSQQKSRNQQVERGGGIKKKIRSVFCICDEHANHYITEAVSDFLICDEHGNHYITEAVSDFFHFKQYSLTHTNSCYFYSRKLY